MDNIIFRKIWQDGEIIELKITANSEYVTAHQRCYIQDTQLEIIANNIKSYTDNYNTACYLEFGKKEGNYTPAFSMLMEPANASGHVKIEVDIEVEDTNTRNHRCLFYITTELGLIHQLSSKLKFLLTAPIDAEVSLLNE